VSSGEVIVGAHTPAIRAAGPARALDLLARLPSAVSTPLC
jgi:hypothetical protein